MTKLQALEWYMEQVADTFRHWFPANASRENQCYIGNWANNDAIPYNWKMFLLDYNALLYQLYENNEQNVQVNFSDLETR